MHKTDVYALLLFTIKTDPALTARIDPPMAGLIIPILIHFNLKVQHLELTHPGRAVRFIFLAAKPSLRTAQKKTVRFMHENRGCVRRKRTGSRFCCRIRRHFRDSAYRISVLLQISGNFVPLPAFCQLCRVHNLSFDAEIRWEIFAAYTISILLLRDGVIAACARMVSE